ncbi:hypothetical protein GCL60_16680 [Silvanigrella paludirubra]|uniref:Uncharacterized protein n=1 Tax=Silvanigrella paludirubra TaxID=2499159 RepID=A0A6N6VRQ7_9BACT|nr:hypothetical protein [Silvanigrella paludirubra]KAB8035865.1 hypothetical protein GCL60_16680 [Silvanigrella paludirubra]
MSKNRSLYLRNQKNEFKEELRKIRIPQTVKQIDPQFVEAVAAIICSFKDGEKLSESQKKGLSIMLIKADKIQDAEFAEKEIQHILNRGKVSVDRRGKDTTLKCAPNFLLYHIDKRIGNWTRRLLAKCLKNPSIARPAFIAHACGAIKAIGKEKAEEALAKSPDELFKLIHEPQYYEAGYRHRSYYIRMQAIGNEQRRLIREKRLNKNT